MSMAACVPAWRAGPSCFASTNEDVLKAPGLAARGNEVPALPPAPWVSVMGSQLPKRGKLCPFWPPVGVSRLFSGVSLPFFFPAGIHACIPACSGQLVQALLVAAAERGFSSSPVAPCFSLAFTPGSEQPGRCEEPS